MYLMYKHDFKLLLTVKEKLNIKFCIVPFHTLMV